MSLTMGIAALAGCSNSDSSSAANSSANSDTTSSGSAVASTHTNDEMTVTSAKDLVAQMKIGWNLGNTMDSTGGTGLDAETSWGNLTTTKEMIDKVKDAGFNVFRLPVSWGTHMSDDYTVDTAWMDRVQEIVNYAIDDGMYVILNTHHEEWYMPQDDTCDKNMEQLTALWSQIAERFKGYDEHLIFEGLNEPRLRGTGAEWTGTDEARAVINKWEKAFYDTVRASGGNNADRCLMITGYAASSAKNNLEAIELPNPDDDKLIVSVHAYLPYSFALDTAGTDIYDENNGEISTLFQNIQSIFIDKGIPVIVGEFGSVNKDNTEDRIKCATDYLTAAKACGVPCIWWDNGTRIGNGENFGLLQRDPAMSSWYFPELIDAMMAVVNG